MEQNINNSLGSLTDNLIKLQNNNNEILLKLSEIVNSDSETITFNIQDTANNSIKTVTIPSLGNIKKDLERLDNNIKQLSTLNNNSADVKLKDGTFRTIIKSNLRKASSSLTSTDIPTTFNFKNNWFFESFLNPYLYVGLNYTGQLNPDTKKVQVKRFILNPDNSEKLTIFNENIKNNTNLSYSDFLDLVSENAISYAIDDDVIDLPPVEPRFYGNFSVLRVFEDNDVTEIDGTEITKKTLKFQLDKLFYNDKNSSVLETQQLKVGDSVLVNKGERNTRYKITKIEFEKNIISVELIEGFDSVAIGSNILSFYNTENLVPEVQIGIGFNEYLGVFIKPIDPFSNIPADEFSPCIGFYTNDLTINDNDTIKTLSTYYQQNVVDFGAHLFSMAKENIPPVYSGIKPSSPVLSAADFKVVQINKHLTDTDNNEEIKTLNNEKNSLKSQISNLDKSINSKRLEINTKNYKSDIEINTDNNILLDLVQKRDSAQTLYNTVVNDIIAKGKEKVLSTSNAKYRVRGFWKIPEPRISSDGKQQEIIQFKIQYRYLTKGGSVNNLDEFNFGEEENKQKGIFSNWIDYDGPLRKRVYDEQSGLFKWEEQLFESGEAININQLDISISQNESVEIRIKSVSEAGYPTTPLESDFSNVVLIEFPDTLGISSDISNIIKETNSENVKIDLINELTEKGVYQHIDDQFTQNNTLWKHQSLNIASGFLSDERNVISLFDYLKKLENKIVELESKIEKTKGVLVVKLEDENGNQKIINNNEVVKVFAGTYKNIVSNLEEPKGEIVSKNYFLRIENQTVTPIELYAGLENRKLNGSRFEKVDDDNYLNVPIGIQLIDTNNVNNINLPFCSAQVKGQFIYSRKYNIEGTNIGNLLYNDLNNNSFLYSSLPEDVVNGFILRSNGTYSTGDGLVMNENDFYIHEEHPFATEFGTQSIKDDYGTLSIKDKNLQTLAKFNTISGQSVLDKRRLGFRPEDKYLIGPGSCRDYMFISPTSYEDIRIDGNDFSTTRNLDNKSTVLIQLQYQFRMTDYFGKGRNGLGRIDGKAGNINPQYKKRMGFDLYYNEQKMSFDIEIFSRYETTGLSQGDIPNLVFQNTLNS